MEKQKFSIDFGGRELSIETGKLAQQANGSVVVKYGDTVILVTAVMNPNLREGINYFPLTVEYEERFYAAGRIKGSRWVKREGRPSDEAILTARMVDRSLRPRFNQKMKNEVQIIITVLDFDEENDPDILALIGASCALMISDIPWSGPVAAARVGRVDNEWVLNPTYENRGKSDLDFVAAGTKDKINMIETKGSEVPEDIICQAADFCHKHIQKIIELQSEIAEKIGSKKVEIPFQEKDLKLKKEIEKFLEDRLEKAVYQKNKNQRGNDINFLKGELIKFIKEEYNDGEKIKQAIELFDEKIDELVHENILKYEKRPDGRKLDELREISCEAGVLPRTHGSGLFGRGETQSISVLTLGSPGMEQYLEGMEYVGRKRFMHHYNFPPFSVGETGRIGWPGRREIGHGALAEKAIESLMPSKEEFPYTIRIVTEILSSNGSSSMASVCGSTLALLDAGVPVSANAAGIAMGLMINKKGDYKILTDIQGPEDHHGDMDLKVAGTRRGVTAMQMDVKIEGVTPQILKDALEQAKKARLEILDIMEKVIAKPREELSRYAPRIISIQINPAKIRDVIGSGGKVINEITSETGVNIDIEDSGLIFITSESAEGAEKAKKWIENLTREVKIGEIFQGKVKKIMEFGAFVEILPGQDGLVHISEIAPHRVEKVEDVIKVGDIVTVKVKRVDENGKISLSMKDAKTQDINKND